MVDIVDQRVPRPSLSAVAVLDEKDDLPDESEKLGELSVERGYPGAIWIIPGGVYVALFSEGTMPKAKRIVRKSGGNVLKVREVKRAFFNGVEYVGGDIDYCSDYNKRFPAIDMKKCELNVGLGGEALFATDEFLFGVMDVDYRGPGTVGGMYSGCYDVDISATLSLDWAYNLDKRWSVVGSFGGNRVKARYFDPFSGLETGRETTYMLDILAGMRYRYMHKEKVSMYSQLQFGVSLNTKGDYWSRNSVSSNHFGWQITAFGISFGSSLFGVCELGWGSEYVAVGIVTGMRLGVGYKF